MFFWNNNFFINYLSCNEKFAISYELIWTFIIFNIDSNICAICSNNYLSQAKVLSDSVYQYDKDNYIFYIVLCDKMSEKVDYSIFHANFIEADKLGIENFKWMTSYYDIVELNTAIKPFAFKYLKNGKSHFIGSS